ncbi:uncharacterized protein LOC135385756 [Ornithodoros turicata]|uniref:uncharacterized protein LOC135385756 n=1 Tax=Ornithodoros turicata TaxID=34597 RepID=UPI00313A4258
MSSAVSTTAGFEEMGTGAHRRTKRQLGGILNTVLGSVGSLVGTGTGLANQGTGLFGLEGDEGIGGVISGTLNLVTVGADVFTGILSTFLGNGDLFSGLIPFFGN